MLRERILQKVGAGMGLVFWVGNFLWCVWGIADRLRGNCIQSLPCYLDGDMLNDQRGIEAPQRAELGEGQRITDSRGQFLHFKDMRSFPRPYKNYEITGEIK